MSELSRANELNKSVYRENSELKVELEQMKVKLVESQKATFSNSSVEAANREELTQVRH